MATIPEILTIFFPGTLWTITDDDYSTLVWDASNSSGKPTESTIRANSIAADTQLAVQRRSQRQQQALNSDAVDAILTAFERVVAGEVELKNKLDDLISKMTTASVTGGKGALAPYDSQVISDIVALRTRIAAIRAIT